MKNKFIHLVTVAALVSGVSVYAHTPKHVRHNKSRSLARDVQVLKEQVKQLRAENKKAKSVLSYNMVEPYAHGSAVVTSPMLGIRDSYKPSDLMVSLPSMNADLSLLEERQKLEAHVIENGVTLPSRPILDVSGGVEGTFSYKHGYTGPAIVDVNLNSAEVDFVGEINPWITSFMALTYDDGKIDGIDSRVNNSRFQLDTGYITIGRLSESPFYFTVGQVYLPFGEYANYRITSPSTKSLGRIKQRAAVVGYSNAGVYGAVYGFQGDTKVVGSVDVLKRGGLNLGYVYSINDVNVDFGAGYTGNIAESAGFDAMHRVLASRVPGADVHAKVAYNQYRIVGEFVTATKAFDVKDLTFNSNGAKPRALDLEAQYEFTAWSKPSSFAFGYGQTWNALALNMPQHDYFVGARTSWWKDTIEAIEYRRDVNYAANSVATVDGLRSTSISPVGSKHGNSVLARIGVYF